MRITTTIVGKVFYLRAGRFTPHMGHYLTWSSDPRGAIELSEADAVVLAERLEIPVSKLIGHCLHVVGVTSLDQFDQKKGFGVLVVHPVASGVGEDGENEPIDTVFASENLIFFREFQGSDLSREWGYMHKYLLKCAADQAQGVAA